MPHERAFYDVYMTLQRLLMSYMPVLLDLGVMHSHIRVLYFKERFFECVPLLLEYDRLVCHGDCRLPVEWLFMAFHSSVRS